MADDKYKNREESLDPEVDQIRTALKLPREYEHLQDILIKLIKRADFFIKSRLIPPSQELARLYN
ncbi:hypothetical protein J4462_02505 [Candidatus Pacearchaeota archaeon]|nr:hypothetical protein [Candidatus Pacearchaeota archaeon]